MRDSEQEILDLGASLTAVGLGDLPHASAFKKETGMSFRLLVDEDRKSHRALDLKAANLLHLLRRDNAASRTRAKAAGHAQHRMGKHPFQLGGSFVFGPGDTDLFVHVSRTFGDTAATGDLLAALRARP